MCSSDLCVQDSCNRRSIRIGRQLADARRRDFLYSLIRLSFYLGLLIIDDLGVERNSEYALGIIFSVIDRRIRSGRPLIITTNLPLKEIKSETMLDKRRIYDRILEMCTPMYVGGTSKREAIASMKMEKAKTLLNTKNDRVYCLSLIHI